MPKFRDLTGETFNGVTAIKPIGKDKHGHFKWLFSCHCGNMFVKVGWEVSSGQAKSCGCLIYGFSTSKSKIKKSFYKRWSGMKRRINNKKSANFDYYGGRGIKYDSRWEYFENFRDDMYESFKKHLRAYGLKNTTLERINNEGDYCADNCKWATIQEQNNNTRRNKYITYKGKKYTKAEFIKLSGIPKDRFYARVKYGWTLEEIMEIPCHGRRKVKK